MKIKIYPGNWVFHPTSDQIKRVKLQHPNVKLESKDANGKKVFLVTESGVLCPNPAVGIFMYPQTPNGSWFVPKNVCSTCILYSKSKTHYPCCNLR